MTTQDTKENAGGVAGFVDDLNEAIRENPVAAGLVGIGVLWMFFGSARISAFGNALPQATKTATNAVGFAAQATGTAVSDALSGTATRLDETARQVGNAISSGAGNAATMVLDKASAASGALKGTGSEATQTMSTDRSSTQFGRGMGISMQENLTRTLQGQPLLLGVIGVAIGAGIASAFPSTKTEQDMMGGAGAAVKDSLHRIASDASERAKDVFVEVKKEASAQGLTSASARDGLNGVVEKVKAAATSSRESLNQRLS